MKIYKIVNGQVVEWGVTPATILTFEADAAGIVAGSKISASQALSIMSIPEIEQAFGVKVAELRDYSAWPEVPAGSRIVSRSASLVNGLIQLDQVTEMIPALPTVANLVTLLETQGLAAKVEARAAQKQRIVDWIVSNYAGITPQQVSTALDNLTQTQKDRLIAAGILLI